MAGIEPSVALIDYGAGNIYSARRALEAAGAGRVIVTDKPQEVRKASHIVLPGVGAFHACMNKLEAHEGMVEMLEAEVREGGKPFLGICVGMQLLADNGYEHQKTGGLGWIAGEVRPIAPRKERPKIPHMGWNDLKLCHPHPLIKGMEDGFFYFVHGYSFIPENEPEYLASTDYGGAICAIVAKDNIIGTQFHPEKSHLGGLAFLKRFLRWRP